MEKQRTNHLIPFIVMLALVLLFGVNISYPDLYEYGPIQKAQLDPSLYPTDYFVQANRGINFQSAVDLILNAFIMLGLSWGGSVMVVYLLCSAIFIMGAVNLLKKWGASNVLLSCILFILIIYMDPIRNVVGGNTVWSKAMSHYKPSACAFIWAICCVTGDKKRYLACFLLLALSCILHIQYGVYGAIFTLIYILCISEPHLLRRSKNPDQAQDKKQLLWRLAKSCLLFIVPTAMFLLLVMSQNSGHLSNKEFVDIYAIFRNPHYISPASWDAQAYIRLLIFSAISFVLVWIAFKACKAAFALRLMQLNLAALIVSGAMVLFNCLCIDVYPLRFVAQMQPARMIQIYKTLLYLSYIYSIDIIVHRIMNASARISIRNVILSLLFIGIMYVGLYRIGEHSLIVFIRTHCAFLLAAVLLATLSLTYGWMKNRSIKIGATAICIAAICAVAMPQFFTLDGGSIRPKRFYALYAAGIEPVIETASRFEQSTDKADLFIADPDNANANALRLWSNRGSIVFFKNIAKKDDAILEWYNRYNALKGFDQKPPDEALSLAQQYGAKYIVLTEDDDLLARYEDTGRTVLLDRQSPLMILQIKDE